MVGMYLYFCVCSVSGFFRLSVLGLYDCERCGRTTILKHKNGLALCTDCYMKEETSEMNDNVMGSSREPDEELGLGDEKEYPKEGPHGEIEITIYRTGGPKSNYVLGTKYMAVDHGDGTYRITQGKEKDCYVAKMFGKPSCELEETQRQKNAYLMWLDNLDDNGPPLKFHTNGKDINDPVRHPPHYTVHPSGVECIQIAEHLNFCLGSALKYIWRCDLKVNPIQDLEKALWYLKKEIDRREKL